MASEDGKGDETNDLVQSFCLAAGEGNLDELRRLHSILNRVDAADSNGWTALLHAAYHRKLECIQWLLSMGADPAFQVPSDVFSEHSVLDFVLQSAQRVLQLDWWQLLAQLVRRGAHRAQVHERVWLKVLFDTITNNCPQAFVELFEELIKVDPEIISRTDSITGFNLLSRACSRCCVDAVRILLKHGAAVNAPCERVGRTALMYACQPEKLFIMLEAARGRAVHNVDMSEAVSVLLGENDAALQIVDLLLENQADVNITAPAGDTALMFACRAGVLPMVQRLVRAGANVHARNQIDMSPLLHASAMARFEVIEWLVKEHDASVHECDVNGRTALANLCWGMVLEHIYHRNHLDTRVSSLKEKFIQNHLCCIRYFTSLGISPDLGDQNGVTPVMIAAQTGFLEALRLLISPQIGAETDLQDKHGLTAWMRAVHTNQIGSQNTLTEHRARTSDLENNRGEPPSPDSPPI